MPKGWHALEGKGGEGAAPAGPRAAREGRTGGPRLGALGAKQKGLILLNSDYLAILVLKGSNALLF